MGWSPIRCSTRSSRRNDAILAACQGLGAWD
jgi:hypothetical protein